VKRILVTDTHLGHKKASDLYLDLTHQLFEDIGAYATENGITELIHLGDFFDNRKNMSLKTLHYARAIGQNLQRFEKSYLIIGNHDLYYKDRYLPNSHQIFGSMDHLTIVDEPTEVGNMILVPWIVEKSDFFDPHDYYTAIENSDAAYCLGHWEINGAKMNVSGREAEGSAWNFSSFAHFKETFSGHFHTPGEYPSNVKYLGASHHMDFNDSGPRGWYVFDDETGDLDFIRWDKAPKYIKWRALPDNIIQGEFTDQIVKIVFDEDYGTTINNQIISDVYSTNPYQVFTEYKFTKMTTGDTVDDDVKLSSPVEVHKDFVEKSEVPKHLNKKVVSKFLDQIYEEVDAQ
jgi:DNA repair exonuclease SbcCD nuclease subunit